MNTVQLVGRLTDNLELKFTQSGDAVANFLLAVNRKYKKEGQPDADFINCVIWKKLAETLAQYTHKGSLIGIEGRIQTRNYENQQGQKVYVTEINVTGFDLLEPKNKANSGVQQQSNVNSQSDQYQGSNKQNFNQNQQREAYDSTTNLFIEDGQPIDIGEDDLPF